MRTKNRCPVKVLHQLSTRRYAAAADDRGLEKNNLVDPETRLPDAERADAAEILRYRFLRIPGGGGELSRLKRFWINKRPALT